MTDDRPAPAATKHPRGLLRLWLRTPLLLYRAGLGRLAGPRLRLTTRGRRTGQLRHTVLEVLERTADGEYLVGAVWGPDCDWYRNIQANGHTEVVAGGDRFRAEVRFLPPTEGDEVLARYVARRRWWVRYGPPGMIGRPMDGVSAPVMGLRPVGRPGPTG